MVAGLSGLRSKRESREKLVELSLQHQSQLAPTDSSFSLKRKVDLWKPGWPAQSYILMGLSGWGQKGNTPPFSYSLFWSPGREGNVASVQSFSPSAQLKDDMPLSSSLALGPCPCQENIQHWGEAANQAALVCVQLSAPSEAHRQNQVNHLDSVSIYQSAHQNLALYNRGWPGDQLHTVLHCQTAIYLYVVVYVLYLYVPVYLGFCNK